MCSGVFCVHKPYFLMPGHIYYWSLDNVLLWIIVVQTHPLFDQSSASLRILNFHAASMHIISCLRYQLLNLVIVEIWLHLSKVASTTLVFKSNFSHQGIPTVLESDNWPQFDSRDMKKLLAPVGFNISQQSLLASK